MFNVKSNETRDMKKMKTNKIKWYAEQILTDRKYKMDTARVPEEFKKEVKSKLLF